MSLNKIIEIANVGRFLSCKNIELSDVNLIYAENGCGKSTLSAITRALPSQNSIIIDERSTLGNAKQPKVKVLIDGNFFAYEKGKWTGDSPKIEVFDDIFVSENIYAGHEINSDHRTGLYEFAIGSLAIDLRHKEKELDDQIEEIDSQRRKLRDSIIKKINMEFSDFISLPAVEDAENKIVDLKSQIDAANSNDSLQKVENLNKLGDLKIEFDFYRQLLEKTIEEISHNAEAVIKEHIANHTHGNGAEKWIERGIGFIQEDSCPFCGQTLNGLDIIGIYRDYFNQEYKNLIIAIDNTIQDLGKQISDDRLISMQGKISQNQSLIDFWRDHIIVKDITFDFDQIKDEWQTIRSKLTNLLVQKRQTPLEPILNVLAGLIDLHTQILSRIQKYDVEVDKINNDISNYKNKIASADTTDLENKLKLLEQTEKRFNDLKDDCDTYEGLKVKRARLDKDRKEAKKELDTENARILEQYRTDINIYLEAFGADFSIIEKIDRRSKGKPRLMLTVVLNGEEIDISNNESGRPNFKNTLSTGDKTSLALAFFFAKMKQMDINQLQKTIVVLDDPITSLGLHRREHTLNEIIKLVPKIKQLILLSHEPYFLRDVNEKVSYVSPNRTSLLQLASNGTETKFVSWQMKKTLKSRYLRHCEAIADFIESGSGGDPSKLEYIKGSIRIVLETALENRFPTDLSENDAFGIHISKIVKCDSKSNLNILKKNNSLMEMLNDLNQYSQPMHHSEGTHKPISERELVTFAKNTLKFVRGEMG